MSAPTNLLSVESPEHFTTVMSQDLNRISLLNFWAPWADPCEQMNQVVKELAGKYPKMLCLNVSSRAINYACWSQLADSSSRSTRRSKPNRNQTFLNPLT